MSVTLHGNQHGTFVKFDGEDLHKLRMLAVLLDCTEEEALDRAIRAKLETEGLA